MISGNRLFAVIAVLMLISVAGAYSDDGAVQVLVDKKPVNGRNVSNAVLYDRGMVPIKDTAELFGATVRWDQNARTLTLVGPTGTGVMRIGSRSGVINGQTIILPNAPYVYGGESYGPIIFFDRYGRSMLIWDPYFRRFRWVAVPGGFFDDAPPPVIYGPAHGRRFETEQPATTPRYQPSTRTVVGEVVRVFPSRTAPTITLTTAGKTVLYTLSRDAIVLRGRTGGQAMEIALGGIRPGDRVTLRLDGTGNVTSIRAQYNQISGTVQSVAQGTVLLESGTTLLITPQTRVILPGNVVGILQDIQTGNTIVASVSPISGRAYVVKVNPQAGETDTSSVQPDDQIAIMAPSILRAGDTVQLQFRAKPGGKASFSIPGIDNLPPMSEVQPGTYAGQYTVQQGDSVVRQPLIVKFVAADGSSYIRTSSRRITVQTGIDYLPRITSPAQGTQIQSPLVVEGFAEPGSTVRVTVEYRANPNRLLPIEGISDIQDVIADEDGVWRTPIPMAAVAPIDENVGIPDIDLGIFSGAYRFPQEPPVIYTITAAAVGADGQPKAQYSIEVTKSPTRRLGGFSPTFIELRERSSG